MFVFFYIGLASPMKTTDVLVTIVHFTSGMPLEINVNIPLNPIGEIDFSRDSHKLALELKSFYNGEKLNPYIDTDVKRPREFYSSFILLKEDRAARATLDLPYPVPDDEGLYELQLFLKLRDVSLGLSQNCSDYLEFLDSYDGLKLPTLLVGSATLRLHYYGRYNFISQIIIVIEYHNFYSKRCTTSGCDSNTTNTSSWWYRLASYSHLFCGGE